jgi:hypothetical protein
LQRQQMDHQRRGLQQHQRVKQLVPTWQPLSERGLEYAAGALWNLSMCSNNWSTLYRAGALQTLRGVLDVIDVIGQQPHQVGHSGGAGLPGHTTADHAAKALKALTK